MDARRLPIAALLALATPATAGAPYPLGQYGRWGAFRAGDHCYAIAQPQRKDGDGAAMVTSWPRRRLFRRLEIRFDRAVEDATVEIGGRRFPLMVDGARARPRPKDERALVAAMRGGGTMRVATHGPDGRHFADSYALDGAASAIDAAGVACLG